MTAVTRRIAGTASLLLVIALTVVWLNNTFAPPRGTIEVTAQLGSAGAGLLAGSDVKLRGARIGRVAATYFEEGQAFARLQIHDIGPCLPSAEELNLVVTAKTLLGEKQVELFFPPDRTLGEEPCLRAGDTLIAAGEPTELQAVIDRLNEVFAAIDEQDIADLFEALGHQRGEGETIRRNIELGQELAAFGARTAQENLESLRALADVAEALAPRAADFNRLSDNLDEATRLLAEREGDLAAALDITASFATGLAEFLEVSRSVIDGLMTTGAVIGELLERRAEDIGGVLEGIIVYGQAVGRGGLLLSDGSEYAPFSVFLTLDFEEVLCLLGGFTDPDECPLNAAAGD